MRIYIVGRLISVSTKSNLEIKKEWFDEKQLLQVKGHFLQVYC